MKTYLECVPCMVQQALDALRVTTNQDEERLRIMRLVLQELSGLVEHVPPPAMGARIHRLISRETGNYDPYRETKDRANRFALDLLPDVQRIVADSADPFETSLRLAVAGNLMDCGAKRHADTSEPAIRRALNDALHAPLNGASASALADEIARAEHVLYLADNAGEIAFDRLFIETSRAKNVTVAVKGRPIINDATMADAEQVGLTRVARVIGNGSDVPGTLLEECSPEFRELFSNSEVIIAKGQGNYETLSERTENIFFLFKVKCPVLARDSGYPSGEMVIMRSRNGQAKPDAQATVGDERVQA